MLNDTCHAIAVNARKAARALPRHAPPAYDRALLAAAQRIEAGAGALMAANAKDLDAAQKANLPPAMIDRLTLTPARLAGIAASLREVAALPCPLGETIRGTVRPNGLELNKVRCPIGVVMIVYESRPNVTTEAASLCLKSGNACILRGGKEAIHTSVALWRAFCDGLDEASLPRDAVQMVETPDREAVGFLLAERDNIDVVIPRGGKGLIERVVREAQMPVIKHFEGICHVYVHAEADLGMAEAICLNSKVQRPGVCNAMETLLVDEAVAEAFLPRVAKVLKAHNVALRGCPRTRQLVPGAAEATDDDWRAEYLDLILSIRVVAGLDEAIDHINTYGSHHTDAIVTRAIEPARAFVGQVDSACVFVNCSTRFSDGGQFGLGAEIGISTDTIHARGPMGLEDLTTYKYVVRGSGQVRE